MLDALEPGHRVRRGLWVALGFAIAIAAYFIYLARQPAPFTHQWPDRWSEIASVCTPLDVDTVVQSYEGGHDELLCYAVAGRFDTVRELAGVPGYPPLYALVYDAHAAAHLGDPRAEAILDAFGGSTNDEHRALAAYHTGDDATAVPLLERVRSVECASPWAQPNCGETPARALAEIASHVPIAERTVECPAVFEADIEASYLWAGCHSASAHCDLAELPLPTWLRARGTCWAAHPSDPRLDRATCLAATGRTAELRAELATATAPTRYHLFATITPFLDDDPFARDALDVLASQDLGWSEALDIGRVAAQHCRVAAATDALTRVPHHVPHTGPQDWPYAHAQALLAKLPSCR